jgi:hypothetical protein
MGGLSLADALLLCELLANADPRRYERAALRWLERFIEERLPPLTEVALAAAALAELRHGERNTGVEALKRLLHPSVVTGRAERKASSRPASHLAEPECSAPRELAAQLPPDGAGRSGSSPRDSGQ